MTDELRVGELANRTGVSVRTLHYYEEIGLLEPAYRTRAEHRVYGREEVARLQRIRSLVHLGLSLEEVKGILANPDFDLERVLELHVERLERTMLLERRLRGRLIALLARLRHREQITVDELLDSIEGTTMLEKHYTQEQLEALERRREALGADRIERAEGEWAELIAEVRAAMERGDDPTSDAVRALARRWRALVEAFTGGDAGIERSVASVWKEEGAALRQRHGDAVPTPEMFAYIGRAGRDADR